VLVLRDFGCGNLLSKPHQSNWLSMIYAKETDPSRQKVIAELYQDITGENIEERLWSLSD